MTNNIPKIRLPEINAKYSRPRKQSIPLDASSVKELFEMNSCEISEAEVTDILNITEGNICIIKDILDQKKADSNFNIQSYKAIGESHLLPLLNQLSIRNKRYLLKVSILDEFNFSLFSKCCLEDDYSDNNFTEFEQFIEEIGRSGHFVKPQDGNDNFKLTAYFKKYSDIVVKKELTKSIIDDVKNKASLYYKEYNPIQSIQLLLDINKVDEAVNTFDELRVQLMNKGKWEELQTVFHAFSKVSESTSCLPLIATELWLSHFDSNLVKMKSLLSTFLELLHKNDNKDNFDVFLGEYHILRAFVAYKLEIDMAMAHKHAHQAIQLLDKYNEYTLGIAWVFYAGALQGLGKKEEAKHAIYHQLELGCSLSLKVNLYMTLCYIYWFDGELDDLLLIAHQLERVSKKSNNLEGLANAHYFQGIGYYYKHDLYNAESHLEILWENRENTILSHRFYGGIAYALNLFEDGQKEQCKVLIQEMEDEAYDHGSSNYLNLIKAVKCYFNWFIDADRSAVEWFIKNKDLPVTALSNFTSLQLLQVKVLVTDQYEGSWNIAISICDNALSQLKGNFNLIFNVRFSIVKALALYRLGKVAEGKSVIEKVLKNVQGMKLEKAFMFYGAVMREFLNQTKFTEHKLNVYVEYILEFLLKHDHQLDTSSSNINENHLTKRESEIIFHLQKNRSYKEVGMELFISESTVKRHIANIFKKKKVNNKKDLLSLYSKTS
ncbi:helix-turn-helix transcriptional regulator [Flammeovirga agarivorans]|uniref:HTH luxR-type domain-containing protein n=1 Tax=Flammeovirga agarivorans TaxID=2726742 RepID=A0A7X8SK93_9BACT|nr:LuxR family transcriptional regulator [Flammeovirga agarivorans]NLR91800.1 hypothetical protein [Flammeovirga agarivorans]